MDYDISILIPTMHSRKKLFDQMKKNLEIQINKIASLKVEILWDCDDGKKTVGKKRNDLLLLAKGKYCCFIDDDDVISEKYLSSFIPMIEDTENDFDCSSLKGEYYKKMVFQKPFFHSNKIEKWYENENGYFRCCNHLNLIKTDICKKIGFQDIKFAEDIDFSMRLYTSGLIQKEFSNDETLYYYIDDLRSTRNFYTFYFDNFGKLCSLITYPKILLKLPSRGRPQKLLNTLKKYIDMASSNPFISITYLITVDADDKSMSQKVLNDIRKLHKNVKVVSGTSQNKIHACNRDMSPDIVNDHDIFMLASDDMIPQKKNWADIVIQKFHDFFPLYDGILHFNDGYTKEKLCTFCILGKEYYKKFNYFYHPDYISLWCDNEYTEVAKINQKYVYDSLVLFLHKHPANDKKIGTDCVYKHNEKFYEKDKKIYVERKQNNFI